jgi:hypothetical protein
VKSGIKDILKKYDTLTFKYKRTQRGKAEIIKDEKYNFL